jgi:hypothetical protein
MHDVYDIIGIFGMSITVVAYFSLSFNILKAGVLYQLMNALGSTGLIISLVVHYNLSAMILESIWLAISLGSIVKIYASSISKKKLS